MSVYKLIGMVILSNSLMFGEKVGILVLYFFLVEMHKHWLFSIKMCDPKENL